MTKLYIGHSNTSNTESESNSHRANK